MPTYRNHRASAVFLSTYGASDARRVLADETFVARSEEVPESWLIPNKGDRVVLGDKHGDGREDEVRDTAKFIQLVSPHPLDEDLPPLKRPVPSSELSVEQMRSELKTDNLKLELQLEHMRQETARLKREAADAEANAATVVAAAAAQAEPTKGTPAPVPAPAAEPTKPAAEPTKEPAKDPAKTKPADK